MQSPPLKRAGRKCANRLDGYGIGVCCRRTLSFHQRTTTRTFGYIYDPYVDIRLRDIERGTGPQLVSGSETRFKAITL